ncbi:MAG: PAS domain-containing protein, partial [Anaerolineales bacterium]|nr:PAS domain-containing protein [Anaerolineales bacterium]
MLNAIRRWWSPPHFDHDPEQAAQARVINALILNTGALLLVAAVILVPFFVVQKISAWGLLGVLLGVLALGRALIFRGRFRLGVTVILTVSWLCFLALTLISTGAANPGMFYLASVILIAGFVLGRRAANALTLLAVLIALAVNGLGSQGLALPAVFIFTPLTGWVAFGLGLAFMNSARSLFVSHLEDALARARQENAARQAAEATLRESEAKFRAQYLGFPLPTYTWRQAGEDWVLVDYNASALAFTQGQVVNVLGQAAGVVYRADPETLHELSQCGRTRTNAQVERWHRLASTGERKYLALNYTFVPPDLVMVHTDDITERRRNEAAVRASEARFRAVVEHTSQGIVFMDAARRIVYASPAYIQLIGTAPQDLI